MISSTFVRRSRTCCPPRAATEMLSCSFLAGRVPSNRMIQSLSSVFNGHPRHHHHHNQIEQSRQWPRNALRYAFTPSSEEIGLRYFSGGAADAVSVSRGNYHHGHHRSNNQQGSGGRKRPSNKSNHKAKEDDERKEILARETTHQILQLGQQVQTSATTTLNDDVVVTNLSHLQPILEELTFWTQADQALKWWASQKTPESVEVSFQMLDALADLSIIAQDPQLSSMILNTKYLNQVVQNWLQVWQSQSHRSADMAQSKATTTTIVMTPEALFQRLEDYRNKAQTTSRTRRKLKPNLETYHLLMEGAAGSSSFSQKQEGWNESVLRHLLEQTHDLSIQPTLKTIAHIIHGWSTRGEVVSKEELEKLLTLMKDLDPSHTSGNNDNDKLKGVDLFNTCIFALANTNSNIKDRRTAKKMLLILNFMQTVAAEYPDLAADIHPNEDTYNTVLNGFSRAGMGAQAEMMLQDMITRYEEAQKRPEDIVSKYAVAPVSKSFTIVMTAYGNSEENWAAEKAGGILRWQQRLNEEENGALQGCIPAEVISYNNVIRAWSLRRSEQAVERCEELRKEMHKYKIAPNAQSYGQSLKCIAMSNLKEKGRQAVQVWREMEFHGVEPNEYVRKYFDKCVAIRSSKKPRRRKERPTAPIRAPRPFD